MLCAVAVMSSGCGSISIPLGDLFGSNAQRTTPPAEVVTGSVPASRVTSTSLPPPTAQAPQPPALALAPTQRASIPAAPPELLSDEDREVVRSAIQHAMLEQDRSALVPWLNQRSGTGGTITAVGSPVNQGPAVCRALLVTVQKGNETRTVQGNACRAPGYEWSLTDLRPFQAPA